MMKGGRNDSAPLGVFGMEKEKPRNLTISRFWQRMKDSNPHIQSQSLLCYHYTNPLYLSAVANRYYYTRNELFVNRFFEFFSNFFIYSISPSNEAAPS